MPRTPPTDPLDTVPDAPAGAGAAGRSQVLVRIGLAGISAVLLGLAQAPGAQFYLAWVGFVPLLLATSGLRPAPAFGLWWMSAAGYFALNMYWIWHATLVGSAAMMAYLAVFWGAAGTVVAVVGRSKWGLVLCFPAAFTALEWVRGWLFTGMPWGMPAHSQSLAAPVLCQVADLGGEHAVNFWLATINAAGCVAWVHRTRLRAAVGVLAFAGALTAGVLGYGVFRLKQTAGATTPGPTVMVVQSAFPHARGGAKTVTFEDLIPFHFDITEQAISTDVRPVHLVAWSETVLPAMNPEAVRRSTNAAMSTQLHERLVEFTTRHGTSLVFGAYALLNFPKNPRDADVRNSTYLYRPGEGLVGRYDKVHLVPFGEIVPFRHSIPWLHELFFKFAAYSVEYVITPGDADAQRPFELPATTGRPAMRFVTPICFEDVHGRLIARLLSGGGGRADFLLNITNDGWFSSGQHRQHLAMAAFRSIENRVWTARACNMGVSGFIDSAGRVVEVIPSGEAGTRVQTIGVDRRRTVYARVGDAFAGACAAVTGVGLAWRLWRRA